MPLFRMFNTVEDAKATASELKSESFGWLGVNIVSRTAEDVSADALAKFAVAPDLAQYYAGRVNGGKTLLIVDAPFGAAAHVTHILRRPRLGDVGTVEVNEVARFVPKRDAASRRAAAPLSAALDWPVLLNDPAPLSARLGWRTLSARQTPRARLLRNAAPLSSVAHVAVLSANPAPFSAAVKAKILLQDAAPLSARIKFKPLLRDATPLSSKLGLAALSRNPTPLSSLLGLPVLSKRR